MSGLQNQQKYILNSNPRLSAVGNAVNFESQIQWKQKSVSNGTLLWMKIATMRLSFPPANGIEMKGHNTALKEWTLS